MYLRYARGDNAWAEGVDMARAFVEGALYRHVTTWTRQGRLGVPADLDGRALCAVLPQVVRDQAELGLLMRDGAPQLLVLPSVCAPGPMALCYGAWPGIEAWERLVEPHLPRGVTLLQTRWNRMPPSPAAAAPRAMCWAPLLVSGA